MTVHAGRKYPVRGKKAKTVGSREQRLGERAEARRELILGWVVDTSRHGAVDHQAVSEATGLPVAYIRHHFPSVDDLLSSANDRLR
jgi:DNA-binding transcriptional regulator YbjK